MSCSRYRDSVVLLADGELTEDASSEVRSHMSGCDSCRATFGELQKLESMLTPATGDPTMAEARFWRSFEADLALRVNRSATPFWRRAIVLPVPAAVAMSLAVAGLSFTVVHQRGETRRLTEENQRWARVAQGWMDERVAVAAPSFHASADFEADKPPAPADSRRSFFRDLSPKMNPRPALDKTFKLPAVEAAGPQLPPGMQIKFVDTAEEQFF